MNQEISERLQKISERIKKEYHAERVILFGSYAKGEATEDSDVDLLVIAPTKERFFERMATVRGLIRDLRNGLPIAPIVLTAHFGISKNFRNVGGRLKGVDPLQG